MSKKKLEASKRIVLFTGIIWCVHIVIASALIFLGAGAQAVSLMNSCMPVYLAVVAGYFGKAGVENVQKIKQISDTLVVNSEDSNG